MCLNIKEPFKGLTMLRLVLSIRRRQRPSALLDAGFPAPSSSQPAHPGLSTHAPGTVDTVHMEQQTEL